MKNKLIMNLIASDLNIQRFRREQDSAYSHRLMFSALASWARVLVLGNSITDGREQADAILDEHAVDRLHIQNRLAQVAFGLLHVLPYDQTYARQLSADKLAEQWASSILEQMLFCYELTKLDNRTIAMSPRRRKRVGEHSLILGGTGWQQKKHHNVGIGRWSLHQTRDANETNQDCLDLHLPSAPDYYDSLLRDACWNKFEPPDTLMIFHTGSGGWYERAWRNLSNKGKLPQGISLLKNPASDGGYFLVQRKRDQFTAAQLDNWYQTENEIYRIMYMLDDHHNRRATFQIKSYEDHVVLHVHSRLPNIERRQLLLSSWPYRHYRDWYYRIIPSFLWSGVQERLNRLGIHTEHTLEWNQRGRSNQDA